MLPPVDVENEFDENAEIPPSPQLKKMRGRVTDKVEQMIAAGHNLASYGKPTLAAGVGGKKAQNWAMVVYRPPVSVASPTADEGRRPRPQPIAVRYCPPGMRIRGAIPMPMPNISAAAPLVKKKIEKRKVNPLVTILSDSESEQERAFVPSGHSGASSSKHAKKYKVGTAPPAPLPMPKKPKALEVDDTVVKFEAKAPEWKSPDARTRVKYILGAFDDLRRQFMVDDQRAREEKSKQRAREEKGKQRAKEAGSGIFRADLKAQSILRGVAHLVNGSESIYGEVPGVEVGDHYYYRVELLMISLHRQMQAGIDYISEAKSKFKDDSGRPKSVAVSVIASGGYEDDRDEGDTLLYTGAGGNNYKGDKRQGEDQDLLRGNLALKNCYDLKLAVRVIRGCECKKSPLNQSPAGRALRIYYYDGMYDVVDCFRETGSSGFKVWKFRLVRKAGQGARSSRLVPFIGKSVPAILEARGEQIISNDLSRGQEPFKVRVVGCRDDDRAPDNFQYITRLKFTPGLPKPAPPASCVCAKSSSLEMNTCKYPEACKVDQSYNEEGSLLRAKRLVYECGPRCFCGSAGKCSNRVAQKGLRYDMEIFKTKGKGWGTRSSYFIPQGSFVCEYIGEIIHERDAEKRVSKDEYMFDLKIPDSMERRFGHVSGLVRANGNSSQHDDDGEDDTNCDKYTVDANRYGNLARFINHSCEPNLFVQCVLYDHHDLRFPHIMLFASEHIPPYKELTYDYGYELNTIKVNGKVKVKICHCGAPSCKGRLY